jgi:quercetin dioxygenase-like cupin family protein
MDTSAFEAELRREGYQEILTRSAKPGPTPVHTHPFDAYAIIVAGEMTVNWDGGSTHCKVGDTFRLDAGREHHEVYGPEGATYLVGRRTRETKAA